MNIFEIIIKRFRLSDQISREDALEYLRWADDDDDKGFNFYKNMRVIYAKFGSDPEVRKALLRRGFRDHEFLWSLTEEDLNTGLLNPSVCKGIVTHMSTSEIVNVLQRWKERVEESKRQKEEAKKKELENLMSELGLSKDDTSKVTVIELMRKVREAKNCSLLDAKKLAEQLKELISATATDPGQQQTK